MSADTLKLGQIIEGEAQRDAIHVAVAPIEAAHKLWPGEEVGLTADGKASKLIVQKVGIVDPFLKVMVAPEERFWLFLFPNTVTGMRHEWQHPAFADAFVTPSPQESAVSSPAETKEDHERWLRAFADNYGFDYGDMVRLAQSPTRYEDLIARNRTVHGTFDLDDGDHELFWHHIQGLTGKLFDPLHRGQVGWSCSC